MGSKGKLIIVASITSDGGLDKAGKNLIPKREYEKWLQDLFKRIDSGKKVIGLDTYEKGLLNKVLKKEDLIIVGVNGVTKETIEIELEKGDVIIVGGEKLFNNFIDKVDQLNILEVAGEYVTNEYFPEYDLDEYKVTYIDDIEGKGFYATEKEYKRKRQDEK